MNYRTLADMAALIRKNVHRIPRVDAVVGIPRSGMIAASMIATLTNQKLYGVELLDNSECSILLVDDSIAGGTTMRSSVQMVRNFNTYATINTLAVFVKPESPKPDIWLEELPGPRVFEWNWHRSKYLTSAVLDIDGVISTPTVPGEREKGKLLYRPARQTRALATGRREEDRAATGVWLVSHNVPFGPIFMSTAGRKGRDTKVYACEMMRPTWVVESDQFQAEYIHAKTGLPVLCVDTNAMITS